MNSLFDASAILFYVGRNEPERLAGGYTSSLAPFELGNAIWKESVLRKGLNAMERGLALDRVTRMLSLMTVLGVEGHEAGIMVAAAELGITYFDAAYTYLAHEVGAMLVTLDGKLAKSAKGYVKVLNPSSASHA
jgi:predicted nucleic acid-binding protein